MTIKNKMNKYSNSVSIAEICFIATSTPDFLNLETFLTDYSEIDFNSQKSKIFELYEALISAIDMNEIKVVSQGRVAIHNPYPCQYYRVCKQSIARWFVSHNEEKLGEMFYHLIKDQAIEMNKPAIKQKVSTREINNDIKALGMAVAYVIENNSPRLVGTLTNPNLSGIANKLENTKFIQATNVMGRETLTQRIKKSISFINDIRE